MRWLDRLRVLVNGRLPLIGIPADESVEVLETQAGRPKVEGPGLTGVPIRHIVVLAIPGRVVAILLQDLGKRPAALRHQGVVAGKARAQFHDDARRRRMVVAAGQKRRARRRAEGRGVELRITQAVLGQPVERLRGDRTAKRARCGEAHVIRQDDEHVGSVLGRRDFAREIGRGVTYLPRNPPAKRCFGSWQHGRRLSSGRRV